MTKDYYEVHEQEYEAMMEWQDYERDMAQQTMEDEGPTEEEVIEMEKAEALREFNRFFYELA